MKYSQSSFTIMVLICHTSNKHQETFNGLQSPIAGVNYGNCFIPEEWINNSKELTTDNLNTCRAKANFFAGLEPRSCRLCLSDNIDIEGLTAKARMLNWLDSYIKEDDFRAMKAWGINLVRVPCGYWNWISGESVDVPKEYHNTVSNLYSMGSPDDYKIYFDRIFEFASKHEMKIFLELHGCPGSQNGEMHSGFFGGKKEKSEEYFHEQRNRELATNAVKLMAMFGMEKSKQYQHEGKFDSFWGIGVLNEPHFDFDKTCLEEYYLTTIQALRNDVQLPSEIPIVLFSWTKDLSYFEPLHQQIKDCGTILWDTHVYNNWQKPLNSIDDITHVNQNDLQRIKKFTESGAKIMIGEFCFCNMPSSFRQKGCEYIVDMFNHVSIGTCVMTLDAPGAWGLCNLAKDIDLKKVYQKPTNELMLTQTYRVNINIVLLMAAWAALIRLIGIYYFQI